MANLTRFENIDELFGDLMNGFFVRPMTYPVKGEGDKPLSIRLDIQEGDTAYKVAADIPGVKKDDIKVTVDGNLVTISAETSNQQEKKEGEKVIYSERSQGLVSRSFTLKQDVDEAGAQAKYENGVLSLTLPKKASSQARRLAVQ
jgi:HSP20 family protein